MALRPHACGEDKRPKPLFLPLIFQTPRVWGRSVIAAIVAKVFFQTPRAWGKVEMCQFLTNWLFSDPTRVGKRKHSLLFYQSFSFRPHACGVDSIEDEIFANNVFQTPRLWGGCRRIVTTFSRVSLSDPTPVGWMNRCFGSWAFCFFQTPRVWGRW